MLRNLIFIALFAIFAVALVAASSEKKAEDLEKSASGWGWPVHHGWGGHSYVHRVQHHGWGGWGQHHQSGWGWPVVHHGWGWGH